MKDFVQAQSLPARGGRVKRVLDPCCGSRMFWFDKQHPDVIYGDIRTETHTLCDGRTLRVFPDVLIDFTKLPYEDGRFRLVVFDPPHLDNTGPKGWQGLKYGRLPRDWKEFIAKGFSECFRVLHDDGVLIFKWNETRIGRRDVLALSPHRPLFGHPTGQNGQTHWYAFMKPRLSPSNPLPSTAEDESQTV